MPTRVFVNILQARSLPVMDRSTGLCDAYVKPQLKGVTFEPVQTQVGEQSQSFFVHAPGGMPTRLGVERGAPPFSLPAREKPHTPRVFGLALYGRTSVMVLACMEEAAGKLFFDIGWRNAQTARKTLNPVWNEQVVPILQRAVPRH
jgi:hypothetical protein